MRVMQHEIRARAGLKTMVAGWIRTLQRRGLRPTVVPLEKTEDRSREIFWITKLRTDGEPLLNETGGGGGIRNPSNRLRMAMSIAATRRPPISEETRAKLKAKGFKHSEEAKQKMRKPKTEAHRKAAADALNAKRASGEYRAARGDANGLRLHPESVLRGEANATSKLTSQAVIEMRRRHANGETTVQLARDFGVRQATAWRIVRGLAWVHLLNQAAPLSGEPRPTTADRVNAST